MYPGFNGNNGLSGRMRTPGQRRRWRKLSRPKGVPESNTSLRRDQTKHHENEQRRQIEVCDPQAADVPRCASERGPQRRQERAATLESPESP